MGEPSDEFVGIDNWRNAQAVAQLRGRQLLVSALLPGQSPCPFSVSVIEHVQAALEANVGVLAEVKYVRLVFDAGTVLI